MKNFLKCICTFKLDSHEANKNIHEKKQTTHFNQ